METFFTNLLNFFGGSRILFHLFVGIVIVFCLLIIGEIIKFLLNTVGRKLISKTESDLDDKILEIILERIIAISGVVGLSFGIAEAQKGVTADHTGVLTFIGYLQNILYIIIALIVTSVVSKILKLLVTYGLRNVAAKNDTDTHSLTPLANRIATFIAFTMAAIVVLDHFGQNISSIITLLGAGSLALGLAAQDTISNMISGFVIMVDRPFRIGDRIKIPSGESGDIYEIGLRSTKILDFDNNLIIVPNNDLIKTKVVNYGYPAGEIRVTVDVGVAYGSDVDQVKHLLVGLARKHPKVLKSPEPEAFLMSLGDSALQFRLVCRVSSFQDQFSTSENLRVQVYNEFRNHGIEIPYPQHVVHVTSNSTNALQGSSKRKKISR